MLEEVWSWQGGTSANDTVEALARGNDGSVVLAGETSGDWNGENAGYFDFVAVKLDADGKVQWRWQDGTDGGDYIRSAATAEDGSTLLFGSTSASWARMTSGSFDFMVAKIDPYGKFVWGWQGGSDEYDFLITGIVRSDGSVFFGGYTTGEWNSSALGGFDHAGTLLSADGNELWRWQGGTDSDDFGLGVALGEDDSIIIAGSTSGSWYAGNEGDFDFVATKLDRDGNFVWGWQGGSPSLESAQACVVGPDGSIYLVGYTYGNFKGDYHAGGVDFAAVKLDADGKELWRWQEGTLWSDEMYAVAVGEDGSIFLAGETEGDWGSTNAGYGDIAVAKIFANGTTSWRWQEGTERRDGSRGIAVGGDGIIYIGGTVKGNYDGPSIGGTDFAVTALFDSTLTDYTRSPAATPSTSNPSGSIRTNSPSPSNSEDIETPVPVITASPMPPSPTPETTAPFASSTPSPTIVQQSSSVVATTLPTTSSTPNALGRAVVPRSSSPSTSLNDSSIIIICVGAVVVISMATLCLCFCWRLRNPQQHSREATLDSNPVDPVDQSGVSQGNTAPKLAWTCGGGGRRFPKPPSYRNICDPPPYPGLPRASSYALGP